MHFQFQYFQCMNQLLCQLFCIIKRVSAAALLVFCMEAIEFPSWREQSLGSISYSNGHHFTLSLCHLFYPLITNVGRTQFTIVSIKTNKRDLNAGLYHCICSLILNPEGIKGQETFLSFLDTVNIDKLAFIVQITEIGSSSKNQKTIRLILICVLLYVPFFL